MKKSIFFVAAVALFASCAEQSTVYTEDGVANEIALSQVVSLSKTVVEGTTFPTTLDFNVFAWYNKEIAVDQPLSKDFTEAYLNDKSFTYSNIGKIWFGGASGTHTPYYWPKTGSMVFAGYHGTANVNYQPVEGYLDSMNILGYTASYTTAGDDLMYFPVTNISYNQNNQPEATVPVTFYHALSWITVKDSCWTFNPSIADLFKIDSIKINDVNPTGDAVIRGTQAKLDTCKWTVNGTAADINLATKDSLVKESLNIYGDEYFVIPQQGSTMTVYYSMKAFGESNTYVEQVPFVYTFTTPWEAGKHYTYVLSFKANEILIEPVIVDWIPVEFGPIDVTK